MKSEVRVPRNFIRAFIVLIVGLSAFGAWAAYANTRPEPPQPEPTPFMPPPESAQTSDFVVQNNDIDLYTKPLYHIVRRWRAGENFEPLPELRAALKESPEIPSTHFWVAARLFNLAMFDGKSERYDDEIEEQFSACLVRAKRAKTLPKFKHAGMYYEGMCKGGLGALHFMRKRHVKAGVLLRECIQAFVELHEQRPEHRPTEYILGSYHYNTARMGTLGKLVLRLLALPVGDRDTGMRMLVKCAKPGNSVDVLSRLTLIDAFQYHENRLADALAMARDTVAMLPQHSGMTLLASELQVMHGYLEQTGAFLKRTRQLLPPDGQMEALPEQKDRAEWTTLIEAFYTMLNAPDDKARDIIFAFGYEEKSENRNIGIMALTFLGHVMRVAQLDKQASIAYKQAADMDGAQFLRDRAKDFDESRDVSKQIALPADRIARLRTILSARSLP
jgi:hypothetical protein